MTIKPSNALKNVRVYIPIIIIIMLIK